MANKNLPVPFGPPPDTELEVILRWAGNEWHVTRGRVLQVELDREVRDLPPEWQTSKDTVYLSGIERLIIIVDTNPKDMEELNEPRDISSVRQPAELPEASGTPQRRR